MKKSIRKNITQASLNLSNWWFVSLEILIASIAISTYLDNVYIFPLSLALLLLSFYNKYTSIYISAFFALFWAFLPLMIMSIFLGVDFFESLPELLSSPASKVLTVIIFFAVFYLHITAADFINDFLDPVVKKFQLKSFLNLKNGRFILKITGPDLERKEVKKYVENILFHLMPLYKNRTIIRIEEVNKIDTNESDFDWAAGLCSYDYKNTINIKIAKEFNGKKLTLDQKMITLAHEIIHCKQFLKGQLDGWIWKGVNYENIEYKKRPWEIEAKHYEDKMFKKYWSY